MVGLVGITGMIGVIVYKLNEIASLCSENRVDTKDVQFSPSPKKCPRLAVEPCSQCTDKELRGVV